MINPEFERGPKLNLSFEAADQTADLEWVLQSSDVDSALAAEALLATFYPAVHQLTLALRIPDEEQPIFIQKAFVSALKNRYRFRSGMDIQQWFYSAIVETLPRDVRRNYWLPMAVVLRTFSSLRIGQIASALHVPSRQVKARLVTLDRHPIQGLEEAGWTIEPDLAAEIERVSWRRALRLRFPPQQLSEDELLHLAEEIAPNAEMRVNRQRRLHTVIEIAVIGLAILLAAGLLLAANLFDPADNPTPTPPPTIIITRVVTRIVLEQHQAGLPTSSPFRSVTPITIPDHFPLPTPTPLPQNDPLPLLSADSSAAEVLERLESSDRAWTTAYGLALLSSYGIRGYNDPEQKTLAEFWVSPSQFRMAYGPPGEPPEELWLGNFNAFQRFNNRRQILISGGEAPPTYQELDIGPLRLLFSPLVHENGQILGAPSILIVRVDPAALETARRPSLVIDVLNFNNQRVARLWLDPQTAFILRGQYFRPDADAAGENISPEVDPAQITFEIELRDLDLDQSFTNQYLFQSHSPVWGYVAPRYHLNRLGLGATPTTVDIPASTIFPTP